jgi:hypothetical protein
MSLCRPGRNGVPMTCRELGLNPRWVQDLNRGNVPCLRSMPDVTLLNSPGTVVLHDHYGSQYRKEDSCLCNDAVEIYTPRSR